MSEPISVSASATAKTAWFFKGIKFILISYVVSLLLIVALSLVLVFTDVPEAVSAPAVKVITFFGAFLSAFLTSRSAGSRGWLRGAINGGFNIMLLIVLGMAIYGSDALSLQNLFMILCGCVAGIAGGILGINTKKD